MGRLNKERIKTICILILIVTGLLQVGILWGYQSQGTPTRFISGLFNFNREPKINDEAVGEKLFVPDRLIMSNGAQYWVVEKENNFYNSLWKEVKQGLTGIADGTVNLAASNEKWKDLIEKRGFIVEFGYGMKPELLRWFLGVGEKRPELPAVYKVLIKPDIVDESSNTIYIYSADGKVYVSDPVRYERERSLGEVLAAFSDNGQKKYRTYRSFRSAKIDESLGAEPDVLYVVGAPKYWSYFEYSSRPPVRGERKEELEEIILGNEEGRYNKSRYSENMTQFTYGNNIYKYYDNGYLTYQYLGNADFSGKGEIGKALLNAYKLVDRISGLSETAPELALTSAEEKQQGIFVFTFDYRLKGMPVKVNADMKDGSKPLTHAVSIQADSKRVLKCEWLTRDFFQGTKGNYNDRFNDVVVMDHTEMAIRDIRGGYFLDETGESLLKPMLLIDMKDETSIQVEMPPEKGD